MGHKTYGRCALFGSANSFASITARARSIEGACGMSPYLSALEAPQSKLRTSIRSLHSQSGDGRRNMRIFCQRRALRTSRTVFVLCSYGVAYGVWYGGRSVRRATYGATYGLGIFKINFRHRNLFRGDNTRKQKHPPNPLRTHRAQQAN